MSNMKCLALSLCLDEEKQWAMRTGYSDVRNIVGTRGGQIFFERHLGAYVNGNYIIDSFQRYNF